MDDERDIRCRCAGCGKPIRLGDALVLDEDETFCGDCIDGSRNAAERDYLLALDEKAPVGPGPGGWPDDADPADPEVEPW